MVWNSIVIKECRPTPLLSNYINSDEGYKYYIQEKDRPFK